MWTGALATALAACRAADAIAGTSGLRRRVHPLFGHGLGERGLHGLEDQEGRGMPGLVVLDRLEHGQIGPPARGRRSTLLQHLAHGIAYLAQLVGPRAD